MTWQDKFERFDAAHPEIYETFTRYARQLLGRGFRHYSAQAIFHAIRFHTDLDGRGPGEPFKLNQNYHAYYARKLMAQEPQFEDFFETRALRSVA